MRFAVLCFVVGVGALGALGSLGVARPVPAARPKIPSVETEVAREFQAGVDAYRLGQYDEARVHLDKAHALDAKLPGPHRFLAAVASAQQHFPECIAQARRAIALNPRSREIEDTRKLHEDCRAQLGRPQFRGALGDSAAIAVVANVPGASVRIGGLRYGGSPVAPRRIKPGIHELDVVKDGFRPAHRAIDALPGIVTDVEIDLEPVPPPGPPRPPRERTSTSVH